MNAIEPVAQVLSCPTVYKTPAVFSRSQGLLSSQINFQTINEEYVIQRIMQEHQAKRSQEQSLWRIGGAIAGLCLGLGDGFQMGDLLGSLFGATASATIGNELQKGDDAKLQELGLEWVNTPESYLYHRKRHRGDALRRLLLIHPHPHTGQPCTVFGVQFPDGYVAHLSLCTSFEQPMFAMQGSGFDTDWVQEKCPLGFLPTDVGLSLPVELWRNVQGLSVVAIPYRAPHHCLY
jgi:hypothetical protein